MSLFAWTSLRPAWAVALLLTWPALPVPFAQAAESASLVVSQTPQPTRVKVVFEVDGQLLTRGTKAQAEGQRLELKAKGQFLYEELATPAAAGDALRYYEQAEAEIAVDGQPSQSALREDRRFVAVSPTESGFHALEGALTREELELIELPAGSQWVDQLLPGRTVKVGETWTHNDQLLAQLLNLSAVTINEVHSELKSIDQERQVAQLKLAGKILGYVAGVLTEVQLEGKYNVDLQKQRVTWLALGIHEQRAAGLTKPGLQVQARVRMLIEEAKPQQLTAETLNAVTLGAPGPTQLLEYQPPHGRFTLMHDRRWYVLSIRPELIVMQMVDDGQLIAQCNLRALPPQGSGEATTLSRFQEEIRSALGSAAQQIIDSNESQQPNGIRQLRVSVVGQVANAPVHWIYYQLTDASRQLVTCVFTMSGQNVERFGAEDIALIGSLTLNPPEATAPAEGQDVARRAAHTPNDRSGKSCPNAARLGAEPPALAAAVRRARLRGGLAGVPSFLRPDLWWTAARHDDGWEHWEDDPGLDEQGQPLGG